MRMSQYYLSLLVLVIGGLTATVLGGLLNKPWHLSVALPTAILVVARHSLVILFVLIGSRLLREAANNCGLSSDYLHRSNAYFRRPSGLFLSLGAAFSIVVAAVLGYAHRAFEFSQGVHLTVGLLATLVTLLAIPFELRALHMVEELLDETREILASEDRQRAERGLGPVDEDHVPYRDSRAHTGLFIAIAPWCVYLYQALIVWQGRFDRVSLHPWVEVSVVGLVIWFRARAKPQPDSQS